MSVVVPADADRSSGSGPTPDRDSAPYWESLREHRLTVQICDSCNELRFPPMPGCPRCGTPDGRWVEAPTSGTVYSWVRVHRSSSQEFAASAPYVIATVELAPGCRIFARLEPNDAAAIGIEVEPCFVDHAEWTEVRFRALSTQCPDGRADG
ncbi:MAG: OB-fold domain-containing protein [Actinobacteria bacterium]|nr:OB-fold domain-containing protein [Actinomycetota bacterium]